MGLGLGDGFWGLSSYLLKIVRTEKSVIFHNFLITQDLSLVSLRIVLSIPELHESEGDLHKGARFLGDNQILMQPYFMLGERSETGSSVPGSWVF